ncbi:MAG: prepilin-type N-terminal cleavage/methylation domain-containing protein [Coxiellaceae bacterium]|nr:prepilin-type N-terminal cleavage/methylation domain-containing protein [Coxiellaceae bacterium]
MKNSAFTLVELIIVIVILGILSAFAIPKFIDVQHDAKKSVDAGIYSSFQSAVNLAHALWVAKGKPSEITMQNETIAMTSTGWPGTTAMSSSDCKNLFDQLLNTNVRVTTSWNDHGKNTFVAMGEGHEYCRYWDSRSSSDGYNQLIYRATNGSFIQRFGDR